MLALDVGTVRTGVALSDELGLFAHPRPAIRSGATAAVLEAVRSIVAQEHVGEVVVGLPLTMAGTRSAQTESVQALIAVLRSQIGVRVSTWDERLTSVQAMRGRPKARDRASGAIDSAAAAVLLQAVLDARRGAVQP